MKTRILLIRWGGLGDLLVALPSIRFLRRAHPSASLTLIGRAEYVSLLLESGVIDDAVSEDSSKISGLFSESGPAGGEGAKWLDAFGLVVAWLNEENTRLPEADRRIGAGDGRWRIIRYDRKAGEPINRFFFGKTLAAAAQTGLTYPASFDECARLPLEFLRADARLAVLRAPAPGQRFTVIHPGSGGETKRWPLDNFLEIARRLGERGVSGAFVTGEAEAALERRVHEAARSLGWASFRSPGLVPLARLLAAADLYLGNDSGVTHLAACCGAETIALFRADLLATWRPSGRVQALSARSVAGIPVDSVWAVVAQALCI